MLSTLVEHKSPVSTRDVLPSVYVIHHKASGFVYVGSSATPGQRVTNHYSMLRLNKHSNVKLQEAYNNDAGVYHVIYKARDREEAYALEKEVIKIYHEKGNLFNVYYTGEVERGYTEERRQQCKTAIGRAAAKEFVDGLRVPNEQRSKRLRIAGQVYDSIMDCARALNVSPITVKLRANSTKPRFEHWQFC